VEDVGDGFDEQRFCEAGRTSDQAMATGEEGDQDLLDHFALADDDLGQFGMNRVSCLDDFFDSTRLGFGDGARWGL